MHNFTDEIAKPKHDIVLFFDCDLTISSFRVSQSMPHRRIGVHFVPFNIIEIKIFFMHNLNFSVRLNLGTLNQILSLGINTRGWWSRQSLSLSIQRLAKSRISYFSSLLAFRHQFGEVWHFRGGDIVIFILIIFISPPGKHCMPKWVMIFARNIRLFVILFFTKSLFTCQVSCLFISLVYLTLYFF